MELVHVVGHDVVGDATVRTVCLVFDVQKAVLPYETMVYGGPLDGSSDCYVTREEAIAGHARMVLRHASKVVP